MTTSLLLSPLSSTVLLKSSFLENSNLIYVPCSANLRDSTVKGRCFRFPTVARALDHITNQFREGNLKDGSKLYLPKVNRSSGAVIDMWIKAKELDANMEYCLELLAKGINKDIQRPKYFQAQEATEYGIVDKIIDSRNNAFEKRNYDEMLAQSKAVRRGAGVGHRQLPLDLGNCKIVSNS